MKPLHPFARTQFFLFGSAVLLIATPVLAETVYLDPKPGSCHIVGDVDVYGIGIRLSFYLQWVAIFIALMFNLEDEAQSMRIGSNIITISAFVNLVRGVSTNSIIFLEWNIFVWLIIYTTIMNLPDPFTEVEDKDIEMGVKMCLIATYFCLNPWVCYIAYNDGMKPGCEVYIITKHTVTRDFFLILGQIGSVPSAFLSGILGIYGSLRFWNGVWNGLTGGKLHEATPTKLSKLLKFCLRPLNEEERKRGSINFRYPFGLGHLLVGPFLIMAIELTIHVNEIDLNAGKFSDSGQLIPFLTGVLSLVIVLWSAMKKIFGPSEFDDSASTKIENVSNDLQHSDESHDDLAPLSPTSGRNGVATSVSENVQEPENAVLRRRTADMEEGRSRAGARSRTSVSSGYAHTL